MQKTLFDLVVSPDKVHPSFEALRSAPVSAPARAALDDVYQDFEDPDGNFLEQFQTTGFDTRYFELYLHAYFTRSGFEIDRTRPYPDFMVSRIGIDAAIEATTVNPSTSGVIHNPCALYPLPKGFFPHAVDTYLVDGMIASDGDGFHPIASRTMNIYDEQKATLRDLRPLSTPIEVYSIPQEVFREVVPVPAIGDFFIREEAWFTDVTHSFLGVVTYDRTDDQWNWAILARDQMFQFRAIEQQVGLPSREEAASQTQLAMAALLRKPKRIFRQ